MRLRPLGESGIQASVVGIGTWAIGGWMWGGTDEKEAIKSIHAALDSGITLLDTAPIYGFGASESIVGKAIADRRERVVLATKCGLVWHTEGGEFYFESDELHPGHGEAKYRVYRWLAPEVIRYEIEQSLKRLKTDCIDLYQTHWQEPTTPIEDSMAELLKLKDEGKIRAIGVSNVSTSDLDQYRSAGAVASAQERFSMLDPKHIEDGLFPYCEEHGIAVLAYCPLEQGLLTGKVGPDRTFKEGDQRNNRKLFSIENRTKVAAMLEEFQPIAANHAASITQLVTAWTLEQTGCTHALVGARTPEQAVENAGGGIMELTQEELDCMSGIIAKHRPGIA